MQNIPIHIDTQELVDSFSLTKREIDSLMDFAIKEITASFANYWEREAKQTLHQTRDAYLMSLKVVDEGRLSGAVVLDYTKNPVVKMIEEGQSPFDLKQGFERSPKKHIKKDGGWYLTVPFRLSTPDAIGESSVFSSKLPSEVYNVVKSKPTPSTGGMSSPLKLSEIPSKYRPPKVREEVVSDQGVVFKAYKHKTSIFEGVSKKTDSVTGQSTYISFRRVSNLSDENSWIHPGIQNYNLAQRALTSFESNIENELSKIIDFGLEKIGKL